MPIAYPRALILGTLCSFGVALALCSGTPARAQAQTAAPPVSFNREILPILSNNCFACHGPDEQKRETRFHFDTEEGAFKKAGVIVRGNAAESLLIEMITHPDPQERMPPADSGHSLTDQQIALLRRWIEEGAKWDTHWAYAAAKRPEPPTPSGCETRSTPSSSRAWSGRG